MLSPQQGTLLHTHLAFTPSVTHSLTMGFNLGCTLELPEGLLEILVSRHTPDGLNQNLWGQDLGITNF